MQLFSLTDITWRYIQRTIFEDLSLTVQDGEKIGLVGQNGVGKTTLFKIIAGIFNLEFGTYDRRKGIRIGYLEQELGIDEEVSLKEFCFAANPENNELRLQLIALERDISGENPPVELVNEFQILSERYEQTGGYRMETEVKLVLDGLGFVFSEVDRPLGSFSGGEKNRAQLAAMLVGDFDLVLMDEPTNHLDIKSTIWLEKYIASSEAAFIIISHDRRFLQNSVDKIAWLAFLKLDLFHCRYEQFIGERKKKIELAEHQYRHQAEEIARIEDFIRRNMAGQKTKQAQSRQKYLARMKRLERPQIESQQQRFHISDGGRSFRQVINVSDLAVGYNQQPLVDQIDFELTRGDRVGLVGPNGCGKTTLLKSLGGEMEPIAGEITIGGNVEMSFFDQDLSNLNYENDVISELWDLDRLAESGRLRSFLARFGFSGDDVFQKISLLSGGEKTKLSLAKILYRPANLMIFDEPTNHLDIGSIEALEEGLANYSGTLLVVSHDRDFLDRVVNIIFEIDGNRLTRYLGNYSDYVARKEGAGGGPPKKQVSVEKRVSYEKFKEQGRVRSRHRKRLKQLAEMIMAAESELSRVEKEQISTDHSNWEMLNELAGEKAALEEKIINLSIEKEQMEKEAPLE